MSDRVNNQTVPPLAARLVDATALAAEVHAGQKKKGTDAPYLAHLLGVTSLVLELGGDSDEVVAALLHDAIEDGSDPAAVRRDILSRFGESVLAIVEGCTDADVKPEPSWRPRKEAFIARLSQASRSVLLVTAADKLHNARSVLADYRQVGEAVWTRFKFGVRCGGRSGIAFASSAGADRLYIHNLNTRGLGWIAR